MAQVVHMQEEGGIRWQQRLQQQNRVQSSCSHRQVLVGWKTCSKKVEVLLSSLAEKDQEEKSLSFPWLVSEIEQGIDYLYPWALIAHVLWIQSHDLLG